MSRHPERSARTLVYAGRNGVYEYRTSWGTFTRLVGTLHTCEAVRCARHSLVSDDGFAVSEPGDPRGDRCTTPVVGAPCEVCGIDT